MKNGSCQIVVVFLQNSDCYAIHFGTRLIGILLYVSSGEHWVLGLLLGVYKGLCSGLESLIKSECKLVDEYGGTITFLSMAQGKIL